MKVLNKSDDYYLNIIIVCCLRHTYLFIMEIFIVQVHENTLCLKMTLGVIQNEQSSVSKHCSDNYPARSVLWLMHIRRAQPNDSQLVLADDITFRVSPKQVESRMRNDDRSCDSLPIFHGCLTVQQSLNIP